MKIRTIVAATSAALFSLGALAAGDQQKQSQGTSGQQSQSAQGSTAGQQSGKQSSSAASGATSGQGSQKQAQSSDLVKQAQEKLKAAGHDVGPVDGIMGPKTQAGVKDFQQKKGLQASGQLDKQTLAALGVSGDMAGGSSAATGGSSSTGQSKGQSSSPAASGSSSGSSSGQSSEKPKQ